MTDQLSQLDVKLEKQPGISLVLSGGATKAFYFHLGVLKVLRPENISSIVGTSAGAVIGAFIASGASVENLLTSLHQKQVYVPKFDSWVKTLTSTMLFKPKYGDIAKQSLLSSYAGLRFMLSLPRLYNRDILAEALDTIIHSQSHISGFFDTVALEDLFKSLLPSADFADTEIDLYVVASALDAAQRAVFNGKYTFQDEENDFMIDVPIHRAVRASSAIPGIFEPVKIKDRYYIDGEVKRTLSADIGVRLADTILISHTYQPLRIQGTGRSINDMGWINIVKQSTSMLFQERIAVWRKIYEREHPEKRIFWIQPDPDDVDFFLAPEFSFRPEVQRKMIKSGEVAALKVLQQIEEDHV
ncbi:MAG: patatin-like phospholipase family protein [Chloroflexi bacterium]|nr:patatin-like phospholipase family protein [Chloroflexota bacterium]